MFIRWLLFGTLVVAHSASVALAQVDLVVKGKANATIVISQAALDAEVITVNRGTIATPAQKVRLAAHDLQHYLHKITGATLPMVAAGTHVDGAAILVGASSATDAVDGLTIASGITKPRLDEASVLFCQGNTIVLAGNDDGAYHGSHNAVSIFLESLGVRWIIPGEFGEVVPTSKTIAVASMHRIEKPSFRFRTWWCNEPRDLGEVHALWRLRNRMQLNDMQIIAIAGDSWLRQYLPDPKLIEEKPDLFGKHFDQSPDPYMPNMSNPETAKLVGDKVIAKLNERKEEGDILDSVGFAPDDGIPMDHTPETIKTMNQGFVDLLGREGDPRGLSVSEEWLTFINRVTEHVNATIPGTIIATNGYANRAAPPEGVELHPNVAIMYASIWADALKPLTYEKSWHSKVRRAQLQKWCDLSNYVYLYEYMNYMLVSMQTPIPQVRKVFEDNQLYAQMGVIGFFNETCFPWMEEGILTRYSRAKLMWNANLDYETHVADFYTNWFGPAATPMRAYGDRLEDCVLHAPLLGHEDRILPYVYTPALLVALEKNISAAEVEAAAEPYATRVRIERLLLEHLKGYMAMREAEFDARYSDCVTHLDAMKDLRMKLHAISPFIAMPPATTGRERYYSGEWYYGLLQRRDHFEKLAHMIDGSEGDLVALAPKQVQFQMDPASIGKDLRWHAPDYDRRAWRDIDTTKPFYIQGYITDDLIPEAGKMWYITDLDVPKSAEGQTVKLYSPIVNCEAWVWINGRYVGHRNYLDAYIRPAPLDFDVTGFIKPGERNTIAVWVSTGGNRSQAPEGFMGRMFLWSPNENSK